MGENTRIARKILDLLEGNNCDFLCSVNLQDLHIVTNGVPNSLFEFNFFIVNKDDFYPILHLRLLSQIDNSSIEAERLKAITHQIRNVECSTDEIAIEKAFSLST